MNFWCWSTRSNNLLFSFFDLFRNAISEMIMFILSGLSTRGPMIETLSEAILEMY